jgi:hypothetical protein
LRYIESTASQAVTVASLSVPGLDRCYSKELLESTRVVITDQICYPPLDQLGLGEFQALNAMRWGGITYNDIHFLRRDLACPSRRYQANRLGNLNRPNAAAREKRTKRWAGQTPGLLYSRHGVENHRPK